MPWFLITLLIPIFSWADSVYVYPVSAKGIPDAEKETIQELFKSAVDAQNGFESTEDQESSKYQLRGAVLKLGGSFIVKAQKNKGSEKLSSKKLKSSDFEDLDVVITRVVRAALEEGSISGTAQVDDVTKDEESRSQRKYKATQQWQFGFGPAWSSNLNDDGTAKALHAGYNWGVDPDFDLQLLGSLYIPNENDDAQFLNMLIGVNYYITRSKNAPYVGGGIGYGVATASDGSTFFSDDDASGWVLGFEGGMKFFRTANVNLGLVLRHSMMLAKTEVSDKSPSVTSFNIIVYY